MPLSVTHTCQHFCHRFSSSCPLQAVKLAYPSMISRYLQGVVQPLNLDA